jgi:hypothetical protein
MPPRFSGSREDAASDAMWGILDYLGDGPASSVSSLASSIMLSSGRPILAIACDEPSLQ